MLTVSPSDLTFIPHSVPQYMGFGLSGSNSFTNMEGADVTISWIDNDEGPMADDYHLRVGNRVQVSESLLH